MKIREEKKKPKLSDLLSMFKGVTDPKQKDKIINHFKKLYGFLETD